MPEREAATHSPLMGYILWIFGFMGAHRFYYGKPISGTLWFLTLGLLFVGWIIDLFLIPGMSQSADRRYAPGVKDYDLSWILLTFLGLFLVGYLYDYWTLNDQIEAVNDEQRSGRV